MRVPDLDEMIAEAEQAEKNRLEGEALRRKPSLREEFIEAVNARQRAMSVGEVVDGFGTKLSAPPLVAPKLDPHTTWDSMRTYLWPERFAPWGIEQP